MRNGGIASPFPEILKSGEAIDPIRLHKTAYRSIMDTLASDGWNLPVLTEDGRIAGILTAQDLVELVEAAQWFVTRLNTNGRLLTPELCRRPPVDSFLFFLYYTIVPPAISTSIPQNLKIFLSC